MVLLSLNKLEPYSETQQDWYSLKQLADTVNLEYDRKVSSKRVSNILFRLGLTKRKKVSGYTLVYAPIELQEESATRIGLSFSSTTSTNSTKSTTAKNWLEKALDVNAREKVKN